MNIVQLIPELNEGGVERGVVEFNRELIKRGFKSFVISKGGKLTKEIEKDGGICINFDVCSKNIFTFPYRIYKLKQIFKKIKPNIIHARSRVPAWISFFAKEKIPFITTVHGFNSVNFYSKIMTKGDRVICVSNSIKEYIQKHYKINDEKIEVIARGVDLEKFNFENLDKSFIDEFKTKFNLNNKLILTTIGRITPLKDFETFIKAIAILKEKNLNIKALIVGGVRKDKEDYFFKLRNLVKSLKVENEVIFCGSQSKMAEIYHLSDVVISSSKKPESFGRSVAEALSLNTPVIATNHGGVKDIIINGVNGYFYEVANANELSEKISKIKILKIDSRNHIKTNFSLNKMVESTIKIYEKFKS
jgi:glycosyltransferase involved in cell wall biosynthesis